VSNNESILEGTIVDERQQVVGFVKENKILILGGVIFLLSFSNSSLRKKNKALIKKVAEMDNLLKDKAGLVAQAERILQNQSMWDYYYGK
jgi:hypothetical protein